MVHRVSPVNATKLLFCYPKIQYRTLSWELVAVLMIAEIVSNGMLSLPSSLAVVGIIPGTIIILFLGIFATFTSWILIQFKLRHPQGEQPIARTPPPFSPPRSLSPEAAR